MMTSKDWAELENGLAKMPLSPPEQEPLAHLVRDLLLRWVRAQRVKTEHEEQQALRRSEQLDPLADILKDIRW